MEYLAEFSYKKQYRREKLLASLILIILVFAAFSHVTNNDFVAYDDDVYVTENPHVQQGLSADGVKWAFTTFRASNWHPITWLSLMADAQLYKLNPSGYHLTNLIIHLINTLLLFLLLAKLTNSVWKGCFAAALFAIHPLHVESVAWISERKDVLSTFFWFAALWTYSDYVKTRSLSRYIFTLVLFALGLMSKPMLVTLPITLLILDWWPLNRVRTAGDWKQLVVEKLPMFAMSAASAVITVIAQQKGGAVNTLDQLNIGVRAANAAWSYAAYIVKMVLPYKLAIPYPHPKATLPTWQVAAAITAIAAISIIALSQSRKRPYLAAGWLWYLITIAPVIGLVQVGCQAMADRYTYVPLIGVFVMLAYVIKAPNTKITRISAAAASAAAIILLAIISHDQVEVWQNSQTLFNHSIECTRGNYIAHNNLGAVLADEGRLEEAVKHYKAALAIEPNYAAANVNLGVWLNRQNRLDEAIYYFQRALKAEPNSYDAHNGLGVALAKKGYYLQALEEFNTALRLNPESSSVKQNLKIIKYLIAEKSGRTAHTQPDQNNISP